MSSTIAEAITNCQERISNSYDTLDMHGYTEPGTKNTTNLPDSIESCFTHQYWTPVHYIQSSGTQRIDTGFNPSGTTGVMLDVKYNTDYSTQGLIGVQGLCIQNQAGGTTWGLNYNSGWANRGPASDTDRHIHGVNINTDKEYTYGKYVLGDTLYDLTTATFTLSYTYNLFCRNNNGVYGGYAQVNMYQCKIWDNGTLVRNFIPCILKSAIPADKDSQGTARYAGNIGMWDTVTDKFYGNSGTGSFVAG